MIKKGIAALLFFCYLCAGTVFAQEPQPLMTEACFYTADLYYCDAERNKLVLKNVNPMGNRNLKNTQTAQDAEYAEISVFGAAQLKDGTSLSLEDCNVYADSKVRVLITRDSAGVLRALQIKFL